MGHVFGNQQNIARTKKKTIEANLKVLHDNIVGKKEFGEDFKIDTEKHLILENNFESSNLESCDYVDKIDKSGLKDFVLCLENPSKKPKKLAKKSKTKAEPVPLFYGNIIKQDMNPKLEKIIGAYVKRPGKKEYIFLEPIKNENDKTKTEELLYTKDTKVNEGKNKKKEDEALSQELQHKMDVSATNSLNNVEIFHMEGEQIQNKPDDEGDITDNYAVINEQEPMETSEDKDIDFLMQTCAINNNCSYNDNNSNNNNNNNDDNDNYNYNNNDDDCNNNNYYEDNIDKDNILDNTNKHNNVVCYKTNIPGNKFISKKEKKAAQVKRKNISYFVTLEGQETGEKDDGNSEEADRGDEIIC